MIHVQALLFTGKLDTFSSSFSAKLLWGVIEQENFAFENSRVQHVPGSNVMSLCTPTDVISPDRATII